MQKGYSTISKQTNNINNTMTFIATARCHYNDLPSILMAAMAMMEP